MTAVRVPGRSRGGLLVVAVILLAVPPLVVALTAGGADLKAAVVALLAALVAGWVTTARPRVTLAAFALVLGLVPYAKVPTTDIPLLLVLALGCWVAVVALPGVRWRVGAPEAGLVLLLTVAGLSVVVTDRSAAALVEYAAWAAATSIVVPIRQLTSSGRRTVMAWFVGAAAVAAACGLLLRWLDPFGLSLRHFAFLGYSATGSNGQFVHGLERETLRLAGTYVEPNIAGLILAVALVITLASTRGALRVALLGLIGAALTLTLSRSALGAVVVAGLLMAALAVGRQRRFVVVSGAAGALALLAVPVVRARLLESFGPSDTGSTARQQALDEYGTAMAGHWWWGLGWAREEFRETAVAWKVNVVANAPLLTAYRGGVLVMAVAVLLLLALVARTFRVDRHAFEPLALACGVTGLCLVALQLDYPVVTQAPATAAFSLLVGLALGRPRSGA